MANITEAAERAKEAKVAKESKKRTRKCKDILGVVETPGTPHLFTIIDGWPSGITRKDKAIKVAKDYQTEEAKAQRPVPEIVFLRRLGTLKGKSQAVMSFVVE
jgi:hypothetical protein